MLHGGGCPDGHGLPGQAAAPPGHGVLRPSTLERWTLICHDVFPKHYATFFSFKSIKLRKQDQDQCREEEGDAVHEGLQARSRQQFLSLPGISRDRHPVRLHHSVRLHLPCRSLLCPHQQYSRNKVECHFLRDSL